MATEKRLVYAREVEEIFNFVEHECSDSYEAFKVAINKATTVDAVSVVRCKDCKHSTWDEEEHLWECTNSYDLTGDADTYAMFHEYNDGEHFCSYGERRTEE